MPIAWEGLGKDTGDGATVEDINISQVRINDVNQTEQCDPQRTVSLQLENTTAQTTRVSFIWLLDRQGRCYRPSNNPDVSTLGP